MKRSKAPRTPGKKPGSKTPVRSIAAKACLAIPLLGGAIARAAEDPVLVERTVSVTNNVTGAGVSGLWVLSNICYAGMRAQNRDSPGWRILAFIFGFPGTLLSFIVVREGSEEAYGIELPKKRGSR